MVIDQAFLKLMTKLNELHGQLTEEGIPIHGVFSDPRRIDYREEATAQQRSRGDAILASFDWELASN